MTKSLYRRRSGTVSAEKWEGPEPRLIGTVIGSVTCNPGDWIVEMTPGNHWVLTQAAFDQMYEPAAT